MAHAHQRMISQLILWATLTCTLSACTSTRTVYTKESYVVEIPVTKKKRQASSLAIKGFKGCDSCDTLRTKAYIEEWLAQTQFMPLVDDISGAQSKHSFILNGSILQEPTGYRLQLKFADATTGEVAYHEVFRGSNLHTLVYDSLGTMFENKEVQQRKERWLKETVMEERRKYRKIPSTVEEFDGVKTLIWVAGFTAAILIAVTVSPE